MLNGSDYDLQQLARRGAPGASETATFDAAAAERRLNHTIAEVINRQNNLQTRVGHAVAELQGLRLDLKERRRDRDSRDRGRDWDAAQRTQPRAERQDPTPPPDPAPGKDSSVVLSTSMSTAVSTAVLSTPAVVATTKVAATAKVAAIKISGTPMPTPEPTGACDAGVEVTMNGSAGVYGNVDIVVGHFLAHAPPHTHTHPSSPSPAHTPWNMLYLVPRLIGELIGAFNPMLCQIPIKIPPLGH